MKTIERYDINGYDRMMQEKTGRYVEYDDHIKQRAKFLKEVKDIMDVMEKRLCGDCLFNSGFKVLQLKLKELEGGDEYSR